MVTQSPAGQETAIRVLGTRRGTFVQFEFQWGGDPDLAVELVLPYPAFREFCDRHRSRMLPAEDKVRLDYERLRRRFETTKTVGAP